VGGGAARASPRPRTTDGPRGEDLWRLEEGRRPRGTEGDGRRRPSHLHEEEATGGGHHTCMRKKMLRVTRYPIVR
jgi:hypothetical protein